MKDIETRPGKTYAVECVGEVTVTNTRTGAVVATGDGSGQVYFVAADVLYTVSDATAIMTELFKPAPRLKLALLQGGAGGWLPAGFTELEYLETSGTQIIATNWTVDASNGARVQWVMLRKANYENVFSARNMDNDGKVINGGTLCVPYWNGVAAKFKGEFMNSSDERYTLDEDVVIGQHYISEANYLNSRQISLNGKILGNIPDDAPNIVVRNMVLFGSSRMGAVFNGARLIGRIFSASVSRNNSIINRLIPVLNANGTPCMYDTVSRTCFYNSGKGTFGYRIKRTGETTAPMSLRDPYYVPPSGVYARKVDENKLEVLADTEETSGDGWEWFANTAEAYEHFGIVPQEEELLTE